MACRLLTHRLVTLRCPHCDRTTLPTAAATPFCCTGCEHAHAFLRSAGLERFYALRASAGGRPIGDARDESDDLWLLGALADDVQASPGAATTTLVLSVQGLHCAGCVWLINQLVALRLGAAARADINPGRGEVTLTFAREKADALVELQHDLHAVGYRLGPRGHRAETGSRDLVVRAGVASAAALYTMSFSLAFYFGLEPNDKDGLHGLFLWATFALGTLSVVIGLPVFAQRALAALRRGAIHLDLPIALGIVLAFAGSVWSFIASEGESAYFDTLTVFVALMLVGRWLQHRVVESNRSTLLEDPGVDTLRVRVVRGTQVAFELASEIRPNDHLVVAPGELVVVDSVLLDDCTTVDVAWINGESTPLEVHRGERVAAGARNRSASAFAVAASTIFSASRLHALLTSHKRDGQGDASQALLPLRNLGAWYVFSTLSLAAVGFAIWWPTSPTRALEVAVAVMVVTCPCALGLALPLALDVTESSLRRMGVFVIGAGFVARAARVTQVLLDKTGTVTDAQLEVANSEVFDTLCDDDRTVLANMVVRSDHPKSAAIVRALRRHRGSVGADHEISDAAIAYDPSIRVVEVPGEGLTGSRVGASALTSPTSQTQYRLDRDGFWNATELLCCFVFEERLRADAAQEVAALHAAGVRVWLLSGDDKARTHDAARRLGIPQEFARGQLSPEEKAIWVRSLDNGDTLMVGDGLNDTLALSAATCAGTPTVSHAALPARADFTYLGGGLGPLAGLLATCRRAVVVARRNLWIAAAYNVGAVGLALMGLMSPWLCAVLMPTSSVLILAHTMGSLWRRDAASTWTLAQPSKASAVRTWVSPLLESSP